MPYRFKKNGKHGDILTPTSSRLPPSETPGSETVAGRTIRGSEKPGKADVAMNFILDHPGICLGTALALGVLVGWLLKRK